MDVNFNWKIRTAVASIKNIIDTKAIILKSKKYKVV